MSATFTLLGLAFATALLGVTFEAHADGDQVVDETTGTRFDEMTQLEGQSFRCLGAGVRKLMMANIYSVAFCVDAAHADLVVAGYIENHHAGVRDAALFKALREDRGFFRMLAEAKLNRLVVLRMHRDLSQKQLASNIRRSLGDLLPEKKLDDLTGAITAGAKKGQVVRIYAFGSTLTVDVAGAVRVIEDEEVARKLFFVWLGAKSVSPTLREDIARRAARRSR